MTGAFVFSCFFFPPVIHYCFLCFFYKANPPPASNRCCDLLFLFGFVFSLCWVPTCMEGLSSKIATLLLLFSVVFPKVKEREKTKYLSLSMSACWEKSFLSRRCFNVGHLVAQNSYIAAKENHPNSSGHIFFFLIILFKIRWRVVTVAAFEYLSLWYSPPMRSTSSMQ